jgi:hypothetical protein
MSQQSWVLTAYVIASGSDGYQVEIALGIHRTQDLNPTSVTLPRNVKKPST